MPLLLIMACCGLAIAPWLPVVLPFTYLYAALLSALLLSVLSARSGGILLCFLAGFIYSSHIISQLDRAILAPQFEAQTTHLTGRVSGLVKQRWLYGSKQQSFDLVLTQPVCFDSKCQHGLTKVRASWVRDNPLIPGQVWQLTAKLKRPRGLSNPAGFDYERWLVTQGVHATATVKTNPQQPHRLVAIDNGLDTWRWHIAEALDERLQSLRHLALIKALLLGDKRGVDQPLWQLFSATGTTHLMVVSGLHIGIIAFLSFQLARLLTTTLNYRLAGLLTSLSSCGSAALYSFIAGLSLPTQRAMMMTVIVVLLSLLARHYRPSTLLLTVVMLCLIIDPMVILGSSFWLSFAAVTAIMVVGTGRTQQSPRSWSSPWLNTQLAVFIGLTPLLLLIFFKAPLLSIIINCLAVPFFSLLLIPLLCLTALAEVVGLPMAYAWQLVDMLIGYFIKFLTIVSEYQWFITISDFSRFNAVLAAMASLLLLLPIKTLQKILAVYLLLPLLIGRNSAIKLGDVTLSVLDIGQGLSVLVETQHHILVYDVGRSWEEGSMVTQVVWPFLQSKRIHRIDHLVVSHNDNDHAGGVEHLLKLADIDKITTGENSHYPHPSLSSCHRQQPWTWDGVQFSFVDYPQHYKNTGNNSSCILSIRSQGYRILIPGDIESSVERQLAKIKPSALRADLLIAPHHGSSSSSSWLFLRHVDPSLVIFSTAYGNRFNHPHPKISRRYQALGVSQYNTAQQGAIRAEINRGSLAEISWQRQKQRFFWQHSSER